MAYILFVNPTVLGASGMDEGSGVHCDCISQCNRLYFDGGVLARYPIGTAPALGINAFFAYSVCLGMGIPWETALSGVFVASLIFILITIFKLREMIHRCDPSRFEICDFWWYRSIYCFPWSERRWDHRFE